MRLRQIFHPRISLLFCALTLLVFAMCSPKYMARERAECISAVEAYNVQRIQAMISADTNALKPLLHPNLRYVHTNGVAENEQEFLNAIGSGKYKFNDFQLDSVRYLSYGRTIVTNGSARIDVFAFEKRYRITTRYTAVYEKYPHGKVSLLSWQNTKTGEW
jgi:Domain of unknown function (DUF4440)